jgi:hypothetical protein
MNRMRTAFRPAPRTLGKRGLLTIATAALLAGCQGGTPWGATPQQVPLPPLPRLQDMSAHIEAGTTAGAQRIAERVRAALAAEPRLAGAQLQVEGFEGGVIVLAGEVPGAAEQDLALHTARGIAGVRQVVDRMRLR